MCRVNQQVQNYKTCLKNWHFGVEKFNFSLGLSFNFFCIDIILLSVYWLKDSFFGIYCLINLFVFSIVPLCHEQYTRVRVKKVLVKVGNLVSFLQLYGCKSRTYKITKR